MSDIAIKVENLGKKYIIDHQREQGYIALRDVITSKVKSIGKSKIEKGIKEEFWALQDINFEIKQGDKVGIIGRNGAGKSTLLKLLSQITEPTTGRISINGRVASLLEVGTGFHPELTGRENIYLNGSILGMSKQEIKKKFDEIVEFAEVEKFLDTPVKRYSSGMYMRLAFSVAAHLHPEILIMDEVLAVGDVKFQKKCIKKIDGMEEEGKTILFVSHNVDMIRRMSGKVMVLEQGNLSYFDENINEGIRLYSDSMIGKIKFDKIDRNCIFNLLEVEILSGNSISIIEPINIRIRYSLNNQVKGFIVGMILKKDGKQILLSYDTDNRPELIEYREKGEYEVIINIPKSFLTIGSYAIDIYGGYLGISVVKTYNECLNFEVNSMGIENPNLSTLREGYLINSPFKWNY